METERDVDLLGCEQSKIPNTEQNTFQNVQISTAGVKYHKNYSQTTYQSHGEHAATLDVLSMHDLEVLPPANAIDRTATIHWGSRPYCFSRDRSCDRPWSQHDAGRYDATDGIRNVLAVHHGVGFLCACGYKPSCQQYS
jgi:hypothetical protein